MSKQKAIIVSGYFNPNYKEYLEYFDIVKAIPEKAVYMQMNEALIDALGDKIQSSSLLVKKL